MTYILHRSTHFTYTHANIHTFIHTKPLIGFLPFCSKWHVTFWIKKLTKKKLVFYYLQNSLWKTMRWGTIIYFRSTYNQLTFSKRALEGLNNLWFMKKSNKRIQYFFPCWTNSELITGQLTPMSLTSLQWYKTEPGCRFTKDKELLF